TPRSPYGLVSAILECLPTPPAATRSGTRTVVSCHGADGRITRDGHEPGGSRACGTAAVRQLAGTGGKDARDGHQYVARSDRPKFEIRRADSGEYAGLLADGHTHPGAWHWREQRGVFGHLRGAAPSFAISGRRSADEAGA